MVLVLLLLVIEARRYRFFDVYRNRVRRLERNYFAQIFRLQPDFASNWMLILGESLRAPKFLVKRRVAFARRLQGATTSTRLSILLLAWVLKISTPSLQREGSPIGFGASFLDAMRVASLGTVPGIVVACIVGFCYAALLAAVFLVSSEEGELSHGTVHV